MATTAKRKKKIRVLSPDGFDIKYDTTYESKEAAEAACKEWAESFRPQGYYSTIRNGERLRIPIEEIPNYCTIS